MKWKTAQKETGLKLEGIEISTYYLDNSIRQITFEDSKGNRINITAPYSTLQVDIPVPLIMVKKFAVLGTYKGLKVKEYFDTKYEAENRQQDFDENITIKEVEIPEE